MIANESSAADLAKLPSAPQATTPASAIAGTHGGGALSAGQGGQPFVAQHGGEGTSTIHNQSFGTGTDVPSSFYPNDYANYESTTQGLLNGSVFTVNMGILINLYRKYKNEEQITFFTPTVVLLILSL
jgi:hypothetical protein